MAQLHIGVRIPKDFSKELQKRYVKAATRAGNDALRAMRANTKKTVRATKKIKAKYLADKALPLKFPKGARKLHDLVWRMSVSGKTVPLSEFPHSQNKKGVRVQVNTGKWDTIKGAFIARVRRTSTMNGTGVFKRPTTKRYPMGHKLGPNVADSVRKYVPFILDHTRAQFNKRFAYWWKKYNG